jgi:hypothetical protein
MPIGVAVSVVDIVKKGREGGGVRVGRRETRSETSDSLKRRTEVGDQMSLFWGIGERAVRLLLPP